MTRQPQAAQTQAEFYVSPVGRDSWSGRLPEPNEAATDGPFATLGRARDAVAYRSRNQAVSTVRSR